MKKTKRNWFKGTAFSGLALFAFGCSATNIESLDAFEEYSIPAADVLPTEDELKGAKPKVVIFEMQDVDEISKKSNSGRTVTAKLREVVGETNAEIIDRQTSDKFSEEIRLAQQNETEYEGPTVADYAIDGSVNLTTFGVTYNPGGDKLNLLTGESEYEKPYCEYSGTVSGEYKLYQLPSNRLVKSFSFEDTETERTGSNESSGFELLGSALFGTEIPEECPIQEGLTSRLTNEAAKEGVRKSRIELQNIFSPKGYVTNMYNSGDVFLIKVSIGTSNGLKQDQKVEIVTVAFSKNALSGETNEEERTVATGLVTNQIQADSAYVLVEPEAASKIRLGDFVNIKFEKSTFEQIGDFSIPGL